MKIQQGYRFRIYPTKAQICLLLQSGGNARYIWNYFLGQNIDRYNMSGKFVFYNEMSAQLPLIKEMLPFVSELFSQSIQQVCKQLDRAISDSFKTDKGFPKFKKKSDFSDSFTIPQKYRIGKSFVFVPKIGEIPMEKHRAILGKVKFITISQDGNQWYCSINVEKHVRVDVVHPVASDVVTIDAGITTYAVLSDDTEVQNPKFLNKHEKKIAKLQKEVAKKKEGSNNRLKAREKLQKEYRGLRNQRKNFLHQTTHDIINTYDVIGVEDLQVKNMMKNHCLAKAIGDCSWSEFFRQLEYKAKWKGKLFIKVSTWFPSSKLCSACGEKNEELTLEDREWTCKKCGVRHNRDKNATYNIRQEVLRLLELKDNVPTDCREYTSVEIDTYTCDGFTSHASMGSEAEKVQRNLVEVIQPSL